MEITIQYQIAEMGARNYEVCIKLMEKQTHTGCFIMFSMITNIYNKKTKGPTLMEFFTATGKLEKFLFDN